MNAISTLKSLAVTTLALAAATKAQAAADLKPIGIVFEEVAATGGEFPQPAYQKITLKFKNVGNQAAGKTIEQACPDFDPDDQLFCNYDVKNVIAGKTLTHMEYATDSKQYLAGKSYSWDFGLAPHTLAHCQQVNVWLDKSKTAGQSGAPSPYTNDVVTLTAVKKGARLCALLDITQ